MDRFDEIRDELAADFERRGASSIIVDWCFDQGSESFRIQAKRLLREALLDARRRQQLLSFLLSELIGGQRLTGKKREGKWRSEPMIGHPALELLLSLGGEHAGDRTRQGHQNALACDTRGHTKKVRKALTDAQEKLQVNPALVQELAWEDIVALTCAMLAADKVPDRRSSLESALELCEDVLWPEGQAPWLAGAPDPRGRLLGDEFANLFEKVAASERGEALEAARSRALAGDASGTYQALRALAVVTAGQQELPNLGFRKGGTGEGHRRKAAISPGLLLRYFDARQMCENDSRAWEDLREDILDLYFATYRDVRCRRLLIPVTIDAQTGVGIYLMGIERYGVYVREPDCGQRNVTVALIDHHLAEPANKSFLAQSKGRARGRAVLGLYPQASSFDKALGSADRLRRGRVEELLDWLYAQYNLRVERSLESSFRPAQGVDRAPVGCPQRFQAYFDQ